MTWTLGKSQPFELDGAGIADTTINKIADQYRESPNLIGLIKNYLQQPAILQQVIFYSLYKFDLDKAVGDQLTIIGRLLGWPRFHCRGQRRPIFGFECEINDEDCPPTQPIGGFCEDAEWDCPGGPEYIPYTFTDDDLYRGFVKARRWMVFGEYAHDGLAQSVRDVFGNQAAILEDGGGVVKVTANRLLSSTEIAIAGLYEQCLPIGPGVRLELYHSKGPVWGFGDGWAGFCEGYWPTKVVT